jgi:hypothetical protein
MSVQCHAETSCRPGKHYIHKEASTESLGDIEYERMTLDFRKLMKTNSYGNCLTSNDILLDGQYNIDMDKEIYTRELLEEYEKVDIDNEV